MVAQDPQGEKDRPPPPRRPAAAGVARAARAIGAARLSADACICVRAWTRMDAGARASSSGGSSAHDRHPRSCRPRPRTRVGKDFEQHGGRHRELALQVYVAHVAACVGHLHARGMRAASGAQGSVRGATRSAGSPACCAHGSRMHAAGLVLEEIEPGSSTLLLLWPRAALNARAGPSLLGLGALHQRRALAPAGHRQKARAGLNAAWARKSC